MHRVRRHSRWLGACVLACTLPAAAWAQGYGQASRHEDRYADEYAARNDVYDYAKVVRVDPILRSGYRSEPVQQQCRYRDADDVYAGGYEEEEDRYRGYEDRGYGTGATPGGRTIATVLGGIAGAVLGSQVGGGSGQVVGTAVGTMVGGAAGRSIYEGNQRQRTVAQRGQVRVCEPVAVSGRDAYEDERVEGYDVAYEYAGRTFHTRTDHHPGDRIRVRVDVTPVDD